MNHHPTTLIDLLRYRIQHQPTQTAYTFLKDGEIEEASLTYQLLDQQARTIATRLQAIGQPGDRVLLLYPSGLDYIAAFFGCLYAGMIAMPVYPPHPKRPMPRLSAIANNAQSKICLTNQTMQQKISPRVTTQAVILKTGGLSLREERSNLRLVKRRLLRRKKHVSQ